MLWGRVELDESLDETRGRSARYLAEGHGTNQSTKDLDEPPDIACDPPPPYKTRHDTPALLVVVLWNVDARCVRSERIERVEVAVRREYQDVDGDASL